MGKSREARSLLIFDIKLSQSQRILLQRLRLTESQALSWGPYGRNEKGFQRLIAFAAEVDADSLQSICLQVECSGEYYSLSDFFLDFITSGLNRQFPHSNFPQEPTPIIAFNLLPFHLGTTKADEIIIGFEQCLFRIPEIRNSSFIVLTRNIDWFTDSDALKELLRKNILANPLIVADCRGYKVSLTRTQRENFSLIPRSFFRDALKLSEDRFYKALIFGTNTYIGHFGTPNSHVRTHYDLYEFVQRDHVLEHLNALCLEIIRGYDKVYIVGEGLEHDTINHMGYCFLQMNSSKVLRFIPYFSRNYPDAEVKKWMNEADCIVLMTDIVNSGDTLRPVIRRLQSLNSQGIEIKVFSIVRMLNSPSDKIDGCEFNTAVTIKREYYRPKEEECLLCQVGQPLREVQKKSDFVWVAEEQLTPLDFWELVEDSKALAIAREDSQERKLLFRVETKAIINNYWHWLSNVIRFKVDTNWPGLEVDAVCTVKEEPGMLFAKLVINSLNMPENALVAISREDLRRTTPTNLPLGKNPFAKFGSDALVVDDGINTGDTIMSLVEFCMVAKRRVRGAIVLDCRLDEHEIKKLEFKVKGKGILRLYSWPSPPIEIG